MNYKLLTIFLSFLLMFSNSSTFAQSSESEVFNGINDYSFILVTGGAASFIGSALFKN